MFHALLCSAQARTTTEANANITWLAKDGIRYRFVIKGDDGEKDTNFNVRKSKRYGDK